MDSPCKRRKDGTGAKTQCNELHEQEVDNSKSVLQKVAHVYAEQLMSDVSLVVGNRTFPAHRLMLCASSDVFCVMLMNPNFNESHEKAVVLTEDPRCEPFFDQFISFMYTGTVRITYESVLPLLLLADKYNITDLQAVSLEYMDEHIVTGAGNGRLVSWIQHTLQQHYSAQYRSFNQNSLNYISWNFDSVSATDHFQNLDADLLVALLQRDDLVIKDEFTLFECISKWLQYRNLHPGSSIAPDSSIGNEAENSGSSALLSTLVTQIMSHIRFRLMSYEDLANVYLDPIYGRYSDLISKHVMEAMKFHAIGSDAREQAFKWMREERGFDMKPFTPRLYVADAWSSAIVVENFSEVPAFATRTFVFETESTLFEKSVKRDRNASKRRRTQESGGTMREWAVELFAKGVIFDKATVIRHRYPSLVVPKWQQDTVRITISSSDSTETAFAVGLLVHGRKDDVDFVTHVYTRRWFFDGSERVLRLDDVLPFQELNLPPTSPVQVQFKPHSQFLIGPERNTLKIQIVITPICH